MGINARNFRELVVVPELARIGLWSHAAEELLMLTAAQESHLGTYLKQGLHRLDDGLGVAVGPYGMEPNTFRWVQSRFPHADLLGGWEAADMVWNLKLATVACRLRYRLVTQPLPASGDVDGLAEYWKQWYNTPLGKGTIDEAKENYERWVTNG